MIYDYLAIGLVVIALGAIVFIISKKFPVIAAINIGILEKHKQEKVKQELIEDRLKRKLAVFNINWLLRKGEAHQSQQPKKKSLLRNIYHSLKELEERYRTKLKEIEPVEVASVEKNKTLLLVEARQFANAEQFKEAEKKYIEAIGLDTRYVEAYRGLADVYMRTKDFIHAKEIYQHLLKLNSKDDATYEGLGKIASTQGNLDEAKKDYLQSISLNNQVAGYHVDLGTVYAALGDHKKGLASFLEAIKLEPNNPRYLDLLIETAIILKNAELADEYLKRLQEVNPENEKVADFKKRIKELSS